MAIDSEERGYDRDYNRKKDITEIHYHYHYPELSSDIKTVLENQNLILKNQKQIMATIQELSAKVDELQTKIDTEQQQVADALATLNQTVSDLQALIVDGGTQAERQAIMDKLNSAISDLESTVADAIPPPPPL